MGAALLGSVRKSGTIWSLSFQEGHATDIFPPPERATMVPVAVEPLLSRVAVSFQKREDLMGQARWLRFAVLGAVLVVSDLAQAKQRFVLATGRRDPRIYAIDLDQALRPQNNNTPNAIVSRSWVNPRRLDGKLLGDPANIVLSEDGKTAFVMNHHGGVVNAEFLQHGGRANIAVLDVRKMIRRELDDSAAALEHNFDAGWFGGVGILVIPDFIIAGYSEGWLTEDGSNRIGLIDRRTGGIRGQIEMPLVDPRLNTRQLRSGCTFFPVAFVSPN